MLKQWIALGVGMAAISPALADWPQFRGPAADGVYPPREDGTPHGFPIEWSETKNVVWKTPVTGKAWSTPVVMGDQVWLTNASADQKRLNYLQMKL